MPPLRKIGNQTVPWLHALAGLARPHSCSAGRARLSPAQASRSAKLASLASMLISELARLTGVTVHALRHYERAGLLRPARLPNG